MMDLCRSGAREVRVEASVLRALLAPPSPTAPLPEPAEASGLLRAEVMDFPEGLADEVRRHAARWYPRLQADGVRPLVEMPVFVHAEEAARDAADLEEVARACTRLMGSAWEAGGLEGLSRLVGARLDQPPGTVTGPAEPSGVMRPDLAPAPEGPRLLELNMNPTIVGASHPFLAEYWDGHPLTKRLRERWDVEFPDFMSGLADHLRRRLRGRRGVLLDLDDGRQRLGDPETGRASRFLAKHGLELETADFKDRRLTVGPDGVFFRGARVDVVLCRFLPQYFFDAGCPARELLDARREGSVELVGGPEHAAPFSKLLLAEAWARTRELTPRQARAVARLLPPTYRTVDAEVVYGGRTTPLRDLALGRRPDFVLKWGMGYQSEHVVIGRATADASWRQAVERAFASGDWVLQEYARPSVTVVPAFSDGELTRYLSASVHSPFLVDGRFAGLHVRSSGVLCGADLTPRGGRILAAGIGAVLRGREKAAERRLDQHQTP